MRTFRARRLLLVCFIPLRAVGTALSLLWGMFTVSWDMPRILRSVDGSCDMFIAMRQLYFHLHLLMVMVTANIERVHRPNLQLPSQVDMGIHNCLPNSKRLPIMACIRSTDAPPEMVMDREWEGRRYTTGSCFLDSTDFDVYIEFRS